MSGSEATMVAEELPEAVTDDAAKVVESTPTPTPREENQAANAPEADTNAPTGSKSSSLINGALMIAISVISGVLGAVVYERMQPPPPRIMVLNMSELLQPIANDPSLNALEKRRITEDIGSALQRSMQIEADNGAIILDASVVLKAPEESYVQP